MKITILNADPNPAATPLNALLEELSARLLAQHHQVNLISLRMLKLTPCTGCFGCWVKKPGECLSADDSCEICRSVIQADFVLWAAPIQMGFPNALLKLALDKSIPLIHPYFAVDQGEAHHRPRYPHYPLLGMLLQPETDTDPTDLEIIQAVFSRTAINMKSHLLFCHSLPISAESIVKEITFAQTYQPTRSSPHLEALAGQTITPPHHITALNGSPRGLKGGTLLMLKKFLDGFSSKPGNEYELITLRRSDPIALSQAFANAECLWLGFPLYTDSMPSIVKEWIETLRPFIGRPNNPPLGFLVQCGFPESLHIRYIERYLQKLASRLGSPYLGTIVKGGGEAIGAMPEQANRKLFGQFHQLGQKFAAQGKLDSTLLRSIATPERYPAWMIPIFKLAIKLPVFNFYWNGQLKRNGVYDQRFARPYLPQEEE